MGEKGWLPLTVRLDDPCEFLEKIYSKFGGRALHLEPILLHLFLLVVLDETLSQIWIVIVDIGHSDIEQVEAETGVETIASKRELELVSTTRHSYWPYESVDSLVDELSFSLRPSRLSTPRLSPIITSDQ